MVLSVVPNALVCCRAPIPSTQAFELLIAVLSSFEGCRQRPNLCCREQTRLYTMIVLQAVIRSSPVLWRHQSDAIFVLPGRIFIVGFLISDHPIRKAENVRRAHEFSRIPSAKADAREGPQPLSLRWTSPDGAPKPRGTHGLSLPLVSLTHHQGLKLMPECIR